ncbi:MAG: Rrf2 family transcriptional regulator [Lachnospiraceae bacterium]|nr:Rrf2 family transcriptional regulator [Lachnospiraceae bacterium]
MKISTKGRYALRMLIELALRKEEGFIPLKEIARKQDISKKYLEQIVPIMNNSGLLLTNRGYQGGYKLAKDPSQITVGMILRATEGSMAPVSCLENQQELCDRSDICMALTVWRGLEEVINEYLDGITLQNILDNNNALQQDYII